MTSSIISLGTWKIRVWLENTIAPRDPKLLFITAESSNATEVGTTGTVAGTPDACA